MPWNGIEKRGEHNCVQLEAMGRIKEFIDNSKGLKATMFTIALAILLQVGTFLYLWGGLTKTVEYHDKMLVSINNKLDKIKIIVVPEAQANSDYVK